jgi:hypothetical protein
MCFGLSFGFGIDRHDPLEDNADTFVVYRIGWSWSLINIQISGDSKPVLIEGYGSISFKIRT